MAQEESSKDDVTLSASPVESLFPSCKIVRIFNGYLQLKEKNLKRMIMDSVESYSLPNDIPVAMLSIVGPPLSGKSFLTNLLIQYYKDGGEGGWLEKLTKKSVDGRQPGMTGFQWGSVDPSLPGIYKPQDSDLATSGVYLWPQPFIMNFHGDKKLLVWILHLCKGVGTRDDDLPTLERFLMLACSRVAEINVGDDDFRILRDAQALKSNQTNSSLLTLPYQEEICDSMVYIFRSKNIASKTKSSTDEKAKKELASLIKNTELDPSVLDAFKHVNIAKIKDVCGDLHDRKGCLDLKVEKDFSKSLKNIVAVITEESEVRPKMTNERELQITDFFQFLKSCVNAVNVLSRQSISDAVSDSPPLPGELPRESSVTSPPQSRKEIVIAAENEKRNPIEFNVAGVLETNLDEGTNVDIYPNAPLPSSDSEDENATGKGFVIVHNADCDEQQEPMSAQALTHSKVSREQFLEERTKNPVSQNLTPFCMSAGVEVKEPKKRAAIFSKEADGKNDATEKASKPLNRKTETADLYSTYGHSIQNQQPGKLPVHHERIPKPSQSDRSLPTGNVEVKSRQPDKAGNATADQMKESKSKKKPENPAPQEEDSIPMDTTPATFHPVVDNQPVQKNSREIKKTIGKEDEPMEVDDNEEAKAAERMLKEEEAKRKAEEQRQIQEKIRRQQEEQLRLERQQKHDAMRNVASNAVLQLKAMIHPSTEKWLTEQLSPKNVTEIRSIYGHLLGAVVAEGHKYVDVTLCGEFESIINAECSNDCMSYLDTIHDRIGKFFTTIKKKFDYYGCLRKDELEKLGKDELGKISQGLLPDNFVIYKLVEIGCVKLMDCFRADNVKITHKEEILAESLIPDVLNFYNEEMTRFLRENIYGPNTLKDIHKTLVGKLVEVFKTAFKFTSRDNICENFEGKLVALREGLGERFAHHLKQNNENSKRMEAEVTKLLKTHKESYIEKIEDVLTKNSDGLEIRELQKKHDEIVNETKKLLTMEIKLKIRQDEPFDVHLRTLQAQIDNYWNCVLDTNSKNMRKRKEREEQERKRVIEERRLEREREDERRRSSRLAEKKAGTTEKSEGRGVSVSTSTGKELPPLVFQLQHTRIKMGMLINDKPRILKNSAGEDSTPFVVGLTTEGDLEYGSEVVADVLREQNGDTLQSNFKKRWLVAEHFIASGDSPLNEQIQLNDSGGTLHRISVEFLLAFILKKLKEHAEAEGKGACSVAVITVPFWFCSTQRIQVKDGARLAGFSEVYLINEATAAAYACASSETRSSSANNIFVISENAELTDASIYEYSSYAKTMKMVGHCGNYCIEESNKGYLKRFTGGLAKFVSNLLWSGTGGERVNEDKKLQTVRKLCKEAQRQSQDSKCALVSETSKPNEVFVTSESEQWRPLLEQIGRECARIIRDINEENGVVFGAALLSRNPTIIGETVKDRLAFDVLRYCELESRIRVIPKTEMLPNQSRKFTTTFPSYKKEGEIFQYVHDCNWSIGSLRVNRNLVNQLIEVCLTISNEAIVKLTDVMITSRSGSSKEYVLRSDYDWITPNLTQEDMARLQSLLESLGAKEQESSELANAKQMLLIKCQEMKEQLKSGTVFKIKSELVKEMFAKKIVEAVTFAHHANSTQIQIEGQLEGLVKWSSKYMK